MITETTITMTTETGTQTEVMRQTDDLRKALKFSHALYMDYLIDNYLGSDQFEDENYAKLAECGFCDIGITIDDNSFIIYSDEYEDKSRYWYSLFQTSAA